MKPIQPTFNAEEYDNKIRQTIPYYEEIYIQAADLINAFRKTHIKWLDIGCGTGKMVEAAGKHCSVDKFVLCDISKEMLEKAEMKLKNSEVKAEFLNCSVQDLSYENEFDIITSIQVNHYFDRNNRMIALKNCYNALKEKGVYIVFENVAPFSKVGKEVGLKRWQDFQVLNGKNLEESKEHISRYGVDYYPITITEHLELLKTCGFMEIEVFWLSYMQIGLYAVKRGQ